MRTLVSKLTHLMHPILAWMKRHTVLASIIGLVVLGVLGKMIFGGGSTPLVTDTAVVQTLQQTVLATGTVTSVTDLDLSFKASAPVSAVRVQVGDVVKKGAVLAMLDNGDELGLLNQARGALQLAQANYDKTVEGATSEEVAIADVALSNAKLDLSHVERTQATLVENARRSMLNSGLIAVPSSASGATVTAPTISGTYTGANTGTYTLTIYSSGSGGYFTMSGLESGTGQISTTTPVALGTLGLYIQFPASFSSTGVNWIITIPNTQASSYVANYNAYQSALETSKSAIQSAQAVVDSRTAELNLKKATARPADISARQADVLAAQGRVQSAESTYENTIIRAPADGMITRVDIKPGELATAQKAVITLQDVSNLYLEANINESNISQIKLDQDVLVTFDALSRDTVYHASISSIDPSATITDGIVNYKVKATLRDPALIKPGMTANMTIVMFSKDNVLVIPKKAIITKDGTTTVLVTTNPKHTKTKQVPVTTGLIGDGNLVEVQSGLVSGDVVVIQQDTTK